MSPLVLISSFLIKVSTPIEKKTFFSPEFSIEKSLEPILRSNFSAPLVTLCNKSLDPLPPFFMTLFGIPYSVYIAWAWINKFLHIQIAYDLIGCIRIESLVKDVQTSGGGGLWFLKESTKTIQMSKMEGFGKNLVSSLFVIRVNWWIYKL